MRQLIGGRYELSVPIGSGGMGEVWEAYDRTLDRRVAVKMLRRSRLPVGTDPHIAAQRFAREARATARLDHPGVPVIFDVGIDGDDLYIVMQRVEGWSLTDLIAERGPLSLPWASAIAAQICAVLAAAHASSLVHRDLKPSNIMVCPGGIVRVLDFGVAAVLDTLEGARLTASGETIGTPAYMAPEQARSGQSSPRSDLYALGCVLHEMLTGAPLFTAPTSYGLMQAHLSQPPASLRTLRPDVPEPLEHLVLDLLAKEPDKRPVEAADVHARLLPYIVKDPPSVTLDPIDPTRVYTVPRGLLPLPRLSETVRHPVRPPSAEPVARDSVSLRDARRQAAELVDADRFTQAAEVLEHALAAVGPALTSDPLALEMRLDLADIMMIGGDYRRALQEYEGLAVDLAAIRGADDETVLRCRAQAAACVAALGDATEALTRLRALLADYEMAMGSADPGALDLRYQIGLLLATSGDTTAAREHLALLLADKERVLGSSSPALDSVRQLLTHLAEIEPRG